MSCYGVVYVSEDFARRYPLSQYVEGDDTAAKRHHAREPYAVVT
jgi:hypothetical protein